MIIDILYNGKNKFLSEYSFLLKLLFSHIWVKYLKIVGSFIEIWKIEQKCRYPGQLFKKRDKSDVLNFHSGRWDVLLKYWTIPYNMGRIWLFSQ